MIRLVQLLRGERVPWYLLGTTVAVFAVFAVASPGTFPSIANLQSMGFQFPETGLLGLGVMLSMVTGGIDLSLVGIANLAGLVATEFLVAAPRLVGHAAPPALVVLGVLLALAVGVGCGAINGILIGVLRFPPILATLASLQFFGGLAIAWTGGHAVLGLPSAFTDIGNASPWGIPVTVFIFAGSALGVGLLLNWRKLGVLMTLVGANPVAARFSGIRVARVLLGAYVASGALASLAGVIIVARTASAAPDYGQSYILLSIVIAILAGVDPNGGFGTVTGIVLATVCLTLIRTGFDSLGFSQFAYQMAQGAIVIAVLALSAAHRTLLLALRRRLSARAVLHRPDLRSVGRGEG